VRAVTSTGSGATTGAYWQFTPPPPPPPLPEASDIQINGGSVPMVFGAGSFTFDASIFGGTNYQWSFGDGSSATGEFVEKEYANPGKYTVSLSFTDAYGRPATLTTPVAKYKEIHDIPSTRAATGDNKVVFDVEYPLDGFIYEWDTGDGQTPVRESRVEKDYTNSTAPGSTSALGFYDVVLNIYDNRQTTPAGIATAATAPVLAGTEYTRVNVYHAKPVAKFTAQHSQSVEGIAIAGYGPLTVNFDASTSTSSDTNNPLTYEWTFGDGTTSTDAITSKTFETPGRFLVTLKVKDKYLQEDTSQTFVYVLTNRQKILSGFRYPQLTASMQAGNLQASNLQTGKSIDVLAEAQVWEAEAMQQNRTVTESSDLTAQGEFSPQNTAFFDDFYPMVTHTSGSILNAIFYPLSGSFVRQGVLTYVNGTQVIPNVTPGVIAAENLANPSELWNSILFTSVGVPKPVRDGINTIQVINISQLFDMKYSAFSGLRVPRVSIAILPDEQMPGDMASPMLTETTIQLNGKKELLLQVNIRESEAQAFAEFDVPVYAVNAQGSHLTNLDGLFRAKFDNLPDSEVVDGMMVQGKAYIKAKLPLNVYGNGQPVDLTRIRIYANTPSCDGTILYRLPNPVAGGTPANTTKSIAGCTFVTATFEAPTNTALPAYAYTLPADFDTTTNKIKLGTNTTEPYDNNFKDVPGNVATFVIGFIPILGDSVDLLTQVYNTAVGKEVDPVLATLATGGLILDITTGGIGDLTSIFKGGYRLSLQLAEQGIGGVLSAVIKEQAQNLLTGAITAKQFIETLAERLKSVVDIALTPGCAPLGLGCLGSYDTVGNFYKAEQNLSPADALKKLDADMKDPLYDDLNINSRDRINDLELSASCLLQFPSSIVAGDIAAQARAVPKNLCPTNPPKVDFPDPLKPTKKRITEASATLDKTYIGGGTNPTKAARDWTKANGNTTDDAGHLLAFSLGGAGGIKADNIVPIDLTLNRGQIAQLEKSIATDLTAGKTVTLKVELKYPTSGKIFRPNEIIYTITTNGVSRIVPFTQ
jgi:PKD repeat protein